MSEYYKYRDYVHGFRNGKSIKTNAISHIRARTVLAVDIEQFFDQITFGRVFGLFRASPFSLPRPVAHAVAAICTRNGVLAQGAPTSPIISNFICRGLDRELFVLAKKSRVTYTRYADDIVFSTRAKSLPSNICLDNAGVNIESVPNIRKIVARQGFALNENKIRLMRKSDRQSVTGITINEFPNVRRSYVRRIRGMIKAIEKFGVPSASSSVISDEWKCNRQFSEGFSEPQSSEEFLVSRLRGMIEFLKFVKGENDPVYKSIANRFNKLGVSKPLFVPHGVHTKLEEAVWVVEFGDSSGTGFFCSGRKFVTCTHCVDIEDKLIDEGDVPFIFNPRNPAYKIDLPEPNFMSSRDNLDIAVYEFSSNIIDSTFALDIELNSRELMYHQEVLYAGYPNHGPGKQIEIRKSRITSNYTRSGNRLAKIDNLIIAGNSGGCVLDQRNKVIGIVRYGTEPGAGATDENSFQYFSSSVAIDSKLGEALAP